MKCSNCGADIAEGSLYCAQCGEEVQIVPVYEVDGEMNLKQTISAFFEEMGLYGEAGVKKTSGEQTGALQEAEQKEKKRKNRMRQMLVSTIGVILVFVILLAIFRQNHSIANLIEQAEQYVAAGDYQNAEMIYKDVLSRENNLSVRLTLADLYASMNEKNSYEQELLKLLEQDTIPSEILSATYERLLQFYYNGDQLEKVTQLLNECREPSILEEFREYVSIAPMADLAEGSYESIQVLKLEVLEDSKIYYTLDGSDPNENSMVYSMPIVLENGSHEVRAYGVNALGIPSRVVTWKFEIQAEQLSPPVVFPISGSYDVPQLIELDGNVDDVYYTMDGSMPNRSSTLYTEPIPMPIGDSVFRFIRITDEGYSNIEERTYQLELADAISAAEAVENVGEYALRVGKMKDNQGNIDDSGAKLQFYYQYVIGIGEPVPEDESPWEGGYFYVVFEKILDSDGTSSYNGNEYAVDIYSGQVYGLKRDAYYNYELVEIEKES